MDKRSYILLAAGAAVGLLSAWLVAGRREAEGGTSDDEQQADTIRRYRRAVERALQEARASRHHDDLKPLSL